MCSVLDLCCFSGAGREVSGLTEASGYFWSSSVVSFLLLAAASASSPSLFPSDVSFVCFIDEVEMTPAAVLSAHSLVDIWTFTAALSTQMVLSECLLKNIAGQQMQWHLRGWWKLKSCHWSCKYTPAEILSTSNFVLFSSWNIQEFLKHFDFREEKRNQTSLKFVRFTLWQWKNTINLNQVP